MSHLRNFIVLSVALLFIHDTDAGPSERRILPTEVEVREGEDVQVRLVKVLNDEATCYVRTPLLVDCNIKLLGNENNLTCDERMHYWSVNGACGFYITNVQKQDDGLWRLTSKNDKEKVMDVVAITVLDKFDSESTQVVEITKGMTYTLTFFDVDQYCLVQNPHDSYSTVVNDVCNVEIRTVSATDQGSWNAIVGVKGQIEETKKTINVSVFYEHVKSGYFITSDPEAIHIYCNYIAIYNSLNMCRFAKSSINQIGLRLREGMRKGRYEYYGNGLDVGECGLTIQSPKEEDYNTWYCMVNTTNKQPIVTAIEVLKPRSNSQQIHDSNIRQKKREVPPIRSSTVSPVITTREQELKLKCSLNKPLSYCWFSQPNGTIYQPNNGSNAMFSNLLQEDTWFEDTYWFGNCEIVIKAEWEHNGTWTCHMGPASPGMELTEDIHVRVAETPLAATQKFVSTNDDIRITLQCKTVPNAMSLSYCRFRSPTGFGIHIDESINENNAIERDNVRYWYSGEGLAVGDCGLVIEPASSIHEGNWTCAAYVELVEGDNESFDTIHFSYDKSTSDVSTESNNTGSVVSIVFGSLGFVIALGTIIIFGIKYKERLWSRLRNQNGDNLMERQDDLSLSTMRTDISVLSRDGGNSGGSNGNRSSRSSSSGGSDNTHNIGSSNRSNNGAQQAQI